MKIYVGNRKVEDGSYQQIPDPSILQHVADDAECTIIILDGVLRKYNLSQVAEIIKLCQKKLRLGGILKVVEVDFDLLVYVYQKLGNIVELNNAFMTNEVRSLLTFDLLLEMMKANAPDVANVNFSRVHNIEFDVEFIRK